MLKHSHAKKLNETQANLGASPTNEKSRHKKQYLCAHTKCRKLFGSLTPVHNTQYHILKRKKTFSNLASRFEIKINQRTSNKNNLENHN